MEQIIIKLKFRINKQTKIKITKSFTINWTKFKQQNRNLRKLTNRPHKQNKLNHPNQTWRLPISNIKFHNWNSTNLASKTPRNKNRKHPHHKTNQKNGKHNPTRPTHLTQITARKTRQQTRPNETRNKQKLNRGTDRNKVTIPPAITGFMNIVWAKYISRVNIK